MSLPPINEETADEFYAWLEEHDKEVFKDGYSTGFGAGYAACLEESEPC